jgi:hypothetical protein
MRTKILVAALACLSVLAVAQQAGNKQEPAKSNEVKSPRDAASGQASGKRTNQQAADQASQSNAAAREASTGKATGKTMAHDDWHAQSAATSGDPHVKNVSTGAVNGDGAAAVRESPTKASTGQTTQVSSDDAAAGVRESPTKASTGLRESPSKQSTQGAAGDVDGDGSADKTAGQSSVQTPRDSSTGMATGKRQHGSITIVKREQAPAATESTPKK